MLARTWRCGNDHLFTFGDEEWHLTENQGFLNDGSPIPRHCPWEFDSIDFPDEPGMWGEPCLDSTSLTMEE